MPPKGRKATGTERQTGSDEEKREEPLQAVVLADSFETRFVPFTLERPRCLLPLANTPLIEYTLEFLANAGVKEIFIYCGAHTKQVEDYIHHSKWSSSASPFAKTELIRSSSRSIGDAMRDLDKRSILVGDFLIVYADVISNVPLEAALAQHRARRAKDKNAIMTMVLREAGTNHRTKAQESCPVFVIDPSKDRCLHFEQIHSLDTKKVVTIDPELLSSHQEIEIRQDLIDCGVDICTPDALALWSDNFDFEAPRRGFLHSVLKDYELNGKTIHTHIVSNHYAARVRNLQAYDAVSKDVISRWAYPLSPDSNLVPGQSYRFQKGNIYKEEGVVLSRSCKIYSGTVIGKDTSVGDGTVISNSVIGRGCNIGMNVKITDSYVWDFAKIEDDSSVQQSVVADEAVVGKRCIIEPGALISYGVRISDGMTVEGTRRITRAKRKRDEYLEKGDPDPEVVGENGDGYDFVDDEASEDPHENLARLGLVYNMVDLSLSADSISTFNTESEDSDQPSHERSRAQSFISVTSEESHHAVDFHHDAVTSIFESLKEGHESTNIQLELTALRMTTNASEHQVRRAVVAAFMKRVIQVIESGVRTKEAVLQVFRSHKELLNRTMFDKNRSKKADQVDFLILIQSDLASQQNGETILLFVCMELYNMDVIEAEGLKQWWVDAESKDDEGMKKVRAKTQQFIDFLASEEEDSEEEEEDDDDDEEEDNEED